MFSYTVFLAKMFYMVPFYTNFKKSLFFFFFEEKLKNADDCCLYSLLNSLQIFTKRKIAGLLYMLQIVNVCMPEGTYGWLIVNN